MDTSLLKTRIKKILNEALTPNQVSKVEDKYKSIYSGMLKGNKKKLMKYIDPKFKRPNPDAMAMGRAINLVKKDTETEEVNEIFPMGSSSSRDQKNRAARARSSNKLSNYHDLLRYYQYAIARIPRHKREKATIPQAMHDRYGQEVWDILKTSYPNEGLSDTPPTNWKDAAGELIQTFTQDYKRTIRKPFYDIDQKLGPKESVNERLASMVREVYSEKQRKWACAQDDPKFDEMCKDTAISKKKIKEYSIIEKEDLTKSEKKKLKKVSSQLKKSVKAHDKQSKIIDKALKETGMGKAKKNMDNYKKQNRLTELIKDALKNPKKADLNKDGKLSDYEKTRGAAIEKAIDKEQVNEDWGSSDQSIMNASVHKALGNPTEFPGLGKLMDVVKDNVDFYMDDFEEYSTDKDSLIHNAAHSYLRQYFPEFYKNMMKMFQPIDEDLDLGHQDNEPHMLKGDLYRIGKYAMELYKMVDQFEYGMGEVDFPSWWQSKIFKAKDALVGAKHYLDFELKEPQIDAVVDIATDVVDEAMTVFSSKEKTIKC